jgi:hypothetical protein
MKDFIFFKSRVGTFSALSQVFVWKRRLGDAKAQTFLKMFFQVLKDPPNLD